jgi:hypothetical protein
VGGVGGEGEGVEMDATELAEVNMQKENYSMSV